MPQGEPERSCWCQELVSWQWELPALSRSARFYERNTPTCPVNWTRWGPVSPPVWEGSRIWIKCNRFPLVPVAGEDQRRRSRSRADGSWLPEPPGPGRSCRLPGGEERHLPHGLHHQLPRWPKNRPSGEEPVDSETPPCGHRGVCSCSDCVLFSHDSKPSSHNVSDLYIF